MNKSRKNKKNEKNKKTNKCNKTKKNIVENCMEKFAEKKIKYWISDTNNEIKNLEKKNVKKLSKEEQKKLIFLKKHRGNQITRLKKQYKLINCNINCKNTLLEAGPPNQIPKSMGKEYHNNKQLIDIFNKQRKNIFKNKTNVLVNNFYENTPLKTKNDLLKEGAISQCSPIQTGGSTIFIDGRMKKTDETYDGKPFFRKVFYYDKTSSDIEKKTRLEQAAEAEIAIVNILMNNPYPNIATYYQVNKDYVEMEELDTSSKKNQTEIMETMTNVKDFLQSLGIMYIDWKDDNIGIAKDGTYKLFDFDVSGLIDLKTNQWIVEPLKFWSYNKAIENGCQTPKEIDDFAFNYGLIKK
jgi:hypothetical protein